MNHATTHASKAGRASLWMLCGAFGFATMSALAHALGSRCDWSVVATVRVLVMLVSAIILTRAAGAKLVFWRPRTLWMRSCAGSFSLVCNFYVLAHLPVADAITLSNVYPLWIVLVPSLLRLKWPTPGELLGVAIALAGVALIQRPQLGGDRLAVLVGLICSASTAVAMLGLHRLRGVDARAVVAHFAGVASLVSVGWLVVRWGQAASGTYDATTVLLLLGVGVTGTLAQILLTKAYASGPPGRVAVVGLTQVAFGLGFDVLLWHRALTPVTLLGFVLVMAPATWLSMRSARRRAPETEPVGSAREPEPALRG
jgi:drug/metabolite transporter (DMT)-like permease